MEFRPCIDIHNGQVKQIVGGSLKDEQGQAEENFISNQDAKFFAKLYKERNIAGGHIILLNPVGSQYYDATRKQAMEALKEFPGGMQIGGGITDQNAEEYLRAGASHVIVTSFVFRDGKIQQDNLEKIQKTVTEKKLVLDLSCRKIGNQYIIVTDRWQKNTDVVITKASLDFFAEYCDEFLIHAVDVEGKAEGIESNLVELLGDWGKKTMTYAGGVHNFEDLKLLKELGKNRIHVTIGSALDLFGGNMNFEQIIQYLKS